MLFSRNNICFSALSLGYALQRRIIDLKVVEEVMSDLDITKHVTEACQIPALGPQFLTVANDDWPLSREAPYAGGRNASSTLTPAEAKAYMQKLATQMKDWKGKLD